MNAKYNVTGKDRKALVETKEFTAYDQALSAFGDVPDGTALRALPRLYGGAEVLARAKELCRNEAALEVLGYLETLWGVLEAAGLSDRVRFDLGLIQTIEYYTGIVFRGYGRGAESAVLSGGRYDRLIGCFGEDMPATGFALDVEAVTKCLDLPEHRRPETLVWYDLRALGQARTLVDSLPAGSAMLSCAATPIDAELEGKVDPGTYPVRIEILEESTGECLGGVTVSVTVLPGLLPKQKLIHTKWFHYDALAHYYRVPVFSERFWEITENFMLAAVAAGDAVMLGRTSQDAMAAVSLATQIQFVQNIVVTSVTAAGVILGAQYWGKKDLRTVGDIFWIMLRICGAISVLFALGCLFAPEALMLVFTNDPALIRIGAGYEAGQFLDGAVDDIRIYDEALDAEDIEALGDFERDMWACRTAGRWQESAAVYYVDGERGDDGT